MRLRTSSSARASGPAPAVAGPSAARPEPVEGSPPAVRRLSILTFFMLHSAFCLPPPSPHAHILYAAFCMLPSAVRRLP